MPANHPKVYNSKNDRDGSKRLEVIEQKFAMGGAKAALNLDIAYRKADHVRDEAYRVVEEARDMCIEREEEVKREALRELKVILKREEEKERARDERHAGATGEGAVVTPGDVGGYDDQGSDLEQEGVADAQSEEPEADDEDCVVIILSEADRAAFEKSERSGSSRRRAIIIEEDDNDDVGDATAPEHKPSNKRPSQGPHPSVKDQPPQKKHKPPTSRNLDAPRVAAKHAPRTRGGSPSPSAFVKESGTCLRARYIDHHFVFIPDACVPVMAEMVADMQNMLAKFFTGVLRADDEGWFIRYEDDADGAGCSRACFEQLKRRKWNGKVDFRMQLVGPGGLIRETNI